MLIPLIFHHLYVCYVTDTEKTQGLFVFPTEGDNDLTFKPTALHHSKDHSFFKTADPLVIRWVCFLCCKSQRMDLVGMQSLLQQQHQSVGRNNVQNGWGGAETASISEQLGCRKGVNWCRSSWYGTPAAAFSSTVCSEQQRLTRSFIVRIWEYACLKSSSVAIPLYFPTLTTRWY